MTRPRLQLHLSTLFIVSLLAAGLVWLNVRGETATTYTKFFDDGGNDSDIFFQRTWRGWPYPFETWIDDTSHLTWASFWCDVAVCLALLAVAAVAIEWLTRRMKRKT